MKTSIVASTLFSAVALAQATGQLGDAAITTNNPAGASYQAVLPDRPTTNIRGQITGTSNANGTGVVWNVNFYGFPDPSLGPFLYHIHDQPVPASGNCTATLAHLDPYIRGEIPPCEPTQPQTCQTGDLSGKFGKIPGTEAYQASYLDLYSTTEEGLGSFIGNRSVVVHTANATRLTCANFQMVGSNGTAIGPTGAGAGGSSNPTATSPPIQSFTGAAAQRFVGGAAVVAGLLAFAL